MKVITGCAVAVVGTTVFKEHPIYKVPKDGTDIERLGAFAAKGCYDSFGDGPEARSCVENQKQMLEHAHGSVLEHSQTSLFIEGISRALSLELNRHRPFAISQRSTRYTKEEDSAMVLEPFYANIWHRYNLTWDENTDELIVPAKYQAGDSVADEEMPKELRLVESFLNVCRETVDEYSNQVNLLMELNPEGKEGFDLRKWARGKARNVLSHALETRGTWTMNYRAWRWFIEVRSSRHAEPEIRRLAEQVLVALNPLAPAYFSDFQLVGIFDGIPEYAPTHRKI